MAATVHIYNQLTYLSLEFTSESSEPFSFVVSLFSSVILAPFLFVTLVFANILNQSTSAIHLLYIHRHVLQMKQLLGTREGNKPALKKIRNDFIITGRLPFPLRGLSQQVQSIFEPILQSCQYR